MAVLLASASDLDDLIPTLVAYQIEWNKLRLRLRAADWPPEGEAPEPAECAAVLGGTEDDWLQLAEAWGEEYVPRLRADGRRAAQPAHPHARRLVGRLRAHDAALVGAGARARCAERALDDRPMYFVSSNPHSMVNLLSGTARRREDEITALGGGRRPRRPARRARRVPRRPHGRLVGELPLLLRARLLRDAARRRCARAALGGGAGGRHHAHLLAHGAARLRPGDRARLARPALARPAARRRRRRRSSRATRR